MCRCEDFPCCGHDTSTGGAWTVDIEYVENLSPEELDPQGSPYDGTDVSDSDFWDDGPDTDLLNEW